MRRPEGGHNLGVLELRAHQRRRGRGWGVRGTPRIQTRSNWERSRTPVGSDLMAAPKVQRQVPESSIHSGETWNAADGHTGWAADGTTHALKELGFG